MAKKKPEPGEERFSEDHKPTKEEAEAYRKKKVEEGRKRKEEREHREREQKKHERETPVVERMIEEDREDANADGGPSRTPEEDMARNDFAARYYARRDHFGFGHGDGRN